MKERKNFIDSEEHAKPVNEVQEINRIMQFSQQSLVMHLTSPIQI